MSAEQMEAAAQLAGLGWDLWYDLAPTLTCYEADVFAEFLRAFDFDTDGFLAQHATADDEGDGHYPDGTRREEEDEEVDAGDRDPVRP